MGLIFLKFHLDRFLAYALYEEPWFPWDYFAPTQSSAFQSVTQQGGNPWQQEWGFLCALMLTAIPFIVIGLVLTLRRLREIGWPRVLVGLFFFPFLNLIFFGVVSIIPHRDTTENAKGWQGTHAFLIRLYSGTTPLRAGVISVVLSALPSILLVLFATVVLEDYGWGLFLGVPFILGMMAVLLDGLAAKPTAKRASAVSASALVFVGALCLMLAIEGAICIAMATPLAIPLAILGGLTAQVIHHSVLRRPDGSIVQACGVAALIVPLLMISETLLPRGPAEIRATTRVEINASPETVWNHVTRFSTLPPTDSFWFTAGIAYPIRARLDGEGVGAIRYCEFSTGAFVEPITQWEPPALLAFDVE
ncbi:SRPBCC family protein, partial [Opitutaceae bacterium]|nr:SRPBCC family protein [Opitutaceae bacterium]